MLLLSSGALRNHPINSVWPYVYLEINIFTLFVYYMYSHPESSAIINVGHPSIMGFIKDQEFATDC